MNSVTISKFCCFLFPFFIYANLSAQKKDDAIEYFTLFHPIYQSNEVDYNPFYKGVIHKKDGSVLNGKISLNYNENTENSTIIKQNDDWEYILNADIDYVVLYNNEQSETLFYAIRDKDILYREIFKKDDKTVVYDSSNKPFEHTLIAPVFVKENEVLVNTFDFWTSGPKKDLVNYINERDGKKYKNRDFKSLEDLFEKL